MASRLQRRPLAAFFLLTFAIAWGVPGMALLVGPALGVAVSVAGYSPLAYVAVWAPAIAAVTLVGATRGRTGLRAYARRMVHPSGRWPWYAAVLLGIPGVYLVAALLSAAAGGPPVGVEAGWVAPFVAVSRSG